MQKNTYFDNLDAIRFFAAMFVFFEHAISNSTIKLYTNNSFFISLRNIICNGETGVILFFILSGFLITNLLISEKILKGSINILNFYKKRILRIWPLYFLVVFIAFFVYPKLVFFLKNTNVEGLNFMYQLFFISNFDLINSYLSNGIGGVLLQNITWSVSIEEQFYLFWPLFFIFLKPNKWIYIFLIVIFFSLLFKVFYYDNEIVLHYHTFSVLIYLSFGGFLAYSKYKYNSCKLFFEKITFNYQILLILSICSMLVFQEFANTYYFLDSFSKIVTAFLFTIFIGVQAYNNNLNGIKLAKFKIFSRLGTYTYGIYLLHPIALMFVSFFLNKYSDSVLFFFILKTLLAFILTLILSILSFHFYESFFLKFKNKLN